MLGHSLCKKLDSNTFDIWGTYNSTPVNNNQFFHLDISKADITKKLPKNYFDYIVICSALTNQEFCQKNPKISKLINYEKTLEIIRFYHARGSFIIFPSTSLVFDGKKQFPEIKDKKNPISKYAEHKSMVEDDLMKYDSEKVSIIRLTKIIGDDYPLFSNWINQLKNKNKVFPFNDMFFSPISISFAIECIRNIILMNKSGPIHISANDDISYSDALFFIADQLKLDCDLIKPKSFLDVNKKLFVPKFSALGSQSLSEINMSSPKPNSSLAEFVKIKSNELF